MRPCPPGLMRGTGRDALPLSPAGAGGPTACPKAWSAGVGPGFEVRLAEDEFDMRLGVMDGLDIKLEELEPAVDGFDISTAVRKRT